MKPIRLWRWRALALALLCGAALSAVAADETGTLIRAVPLQKLPASDAATLAQLPEQTAVRILNRQGAWLQVKTEQGQGWVKLLAVRTAPGSGAGASGVGALFNVARSGASGSAVATGVRGLSKVQVQNAVPDFAELAKLNAYTVSSAQAEAFAQSRPPLHAQSVPYLGGAAR
jgi:hypothetical protein